ncbi:MAG: BON domain-containing protein [Betaproteobacteria bacterium]|nr:BON domain-containing protein [Betaproteobacteria bacterium]
MRQARLKFLLAWGAIATALAAPGALAQFNPFTILGEVVSTAMDVRTMAEVRNDIAISAGVNQTLLDDERAQWKGVTVLVFAQHVVLAGAVRTAEARKIAEDAARSDERVRSLRNDLIVIKKPGEEGSFVRDKATDVKINAKLTAAEGVSSVNMRWKTVNGEVVLMGVARSDEEAQLAVAKIREIEEVKGVKSRLRIVPKKE